MTCHNCQKLFSDPAQPDLQTAVPITPRPRLGALERINQSRTNVRDLPNYQGATYGVWRDKDGYDRDGYNKKGFNRAGWDRYGYNEQGYNRAGFNRQGLDSEGVYANGFTMLGIRKKTSDDGKPAGTGPEGYSLIGLDLTARDKDGYDYKGYGKSEDPNDPQNPHMMYDRAGYNKFGVHRDGHRHPFFAQDAEGYYPDGFDTFGFDREGYNKYGLDRLGRPRPKDGEKQPVPPPPITPFASMTQAEYLKTIPPDAPRYEFEEISDRDLSPTELQEAVVAKRFQFSELGRASTDPKACYLGLLMRCCYCGQFVGAQPHQCPHPKIAQFANGQLVKVYLNGAASIDIPGKDGKRKTNQWIATPYNPDFDPRYNMPPHYGYLFGTGRDKDGYDIHGYDEDGYDRYGFDREGFDRDGWDRMGYNRFGQHKDGHIRPNPIHSVQRYLDDGTTLLDNQAMVSVYSRLATGLLRRPCQVTLVKGGGFSTDLKGHIIADPYPMGEDAPPRENLVCTKAGIGHELSHEIYTDQAIFARIREIALSDKPIEGLDKGRAIVKDLFNVIEDGRIERLISNRYPGIGECLLAFSTLVPRWSEQVGPGIPDGEQLLWSMLYTALPFYEVKDEVRQAMTPKARELLEEFEPIIDAAVHGSCEDTYYAVMYIAKRMEEENLLDDMQTNVMPDPPVDQQVKPIILPGKPPKGLKQPGGDSGESGQGAPVFYSEAPDPDDGADQNGDSGSSPAKPKKYKQYVDGYAPEGSGGGSQEYGGDVEYIPKNDPRSPDYKPQNNQTDGGGGGQQSDSQQGNQSGRGSSGQQSGDQQGDQMGGGSSGQQSGDQQGDQMGSGHRPGGQQDDQTGSGGSRQPGGQQDDQTGSGSGRQSGGQQDDQSGSSGQSGDQQGQGSAGSDAGQDSTTGRSQGGQNQPGGEGGGMTVGNQINAGEDAADSVFRRYGGDPGAIGKILDTVEEQATNAIITDVRNRCRPDVLGKHLHAPLGDRDEVEQVYRSLDGLPEKVRVSLPRETNSRTLRTLEARRASHQQVAKDMARVLKAVRAETERMLRNQTRGRMDGRRIVQARLGSKEVRVQSVEVPETKMTASIAIDMSGSMRNFISSCNLYDAAMTLSDTFDELEAPHEVRAFGSTDVQVRSMKDKHFDPTRAAFLATGGLGGTELQHTASLAITSLAGREEQNKMFICLSDGNLSGDDFPKTAEILQEARRNGIVTLGIFLESDWERANAEQLNQLYGPGNWVKVRNLSSFPQIVAGRLVQIYKSLRRH